MKFQKTDIKKMLIQSEKSGEQQRAKMAAELCHMNEPNIILPDLFSIILGGAVGSPSCV